MTKINEFNYKKELLFTIITAVIFYIAIFIPFIMVDTTYGSLNMDINGIYKIPRSILDAISLDVFPVSDILAIIAMLVFVDLVVGVRNYIKKIKLNEKHLKFRTIFSAILVVILFGLIIFWNYYETIYISTGFYMLILVMILNIVRDKNRYFNNIIKSKMIIKYTKIIATFILVAIIYFFYNISHSWSQTNGFLKLLEIKEETYIVLYRETTIEVEFDDLGDLSLVEGNWYDVQYTESSYGVFLFRIYESTFIVIDTVEFTD